MPLIIKHNQQDITKEISVYEWDQNRHNKENWTVIKETGLVRLFLWDKKNEIWLERHRMEIADANDLQKRELDQVRFEPLPNYTKTSETTIFDGEIPSLITNAQKDFINFSNNKNESHNENYSKSALRDNPSITNVVTATNADHPKKIKSDTWPVRIFNKIIDNTILLVITIIGTLIGTLLV